MPKVSVIIPTYNRGYIVREAIDSVLAQTFEDFEAIVVDDGSTDDTAEKIAAIRDPRIRYIHGINAGAAVARNRGLAEARGEIISFLDSDDQWTPDKLEANVSFLERYPCAAAVFSDAADWPAFKEWIRDKPLEPELLVPARDLYLMLLQQVTVRTSSLTVRAAVAHSAGPFDARINGCEDCEWFFRLSRKRDFGYINRRLTILRSSADGIHARFPKKDNEVRFLREERKKIRRCDRAARRASRIGILGQARLGIWQAQAGGNTNLAIATALHVFAATASPEMLMRAAWVCLPRHLTRRAATSSSR